MASVFFSKMSQVILIWFSIFVISKCVLLPFCYTLCIVLSFVCFSHRGKTKINDGVFRIKLKWMGDVGTAQSFFFSWHFSFLFFQVLFLNMPKNSNRLISSSFQKILTILFPQVLVAQIYIFFLKRERLKYS